MNRNCQRVDTERSIRLISLPMRGPTPEMLKLLVAFSTWIWSGAPRPPAMLQSFSLSLSLPQKFHRKKLSNLSLRKPVSETLTKEKRFRTLSLSLEKLQEEEPTPSETPVLLLFLRLVTVALLFILCVMLSCLHLLLCLGVVTLMLHRLRLLFWLFHL